MGQGMEGKGRGGEGKGRETLVLKKKGKKKLNLLKINSTDRLSSYVANPALW